MATKFQFNQDSNYKALIYFADGNKRTFHSRDLTNNNELKPELGLQKLRKMIANFGISVKLAIVYDKIQNKEIERYPKIAELPTNAEPKSKSKFKAVIYFKDGNRRTFHSYDVDTTTGEVNPNIGLNKLSKMIEKFGDKVNLSFLIDKETDNPVIFE